MPYSKNPHKYPPELEGLLQLLAKRREPLTIQCESPNEAMGKRIMIQSYFRAVAAHSEELSVASVRLRAKPAARGEAGKGLLDTGPLAMDVAVAVELADRWEGYAQTSHQWMVGVDKAKAQVILKPRTLEGSVFGDSLLQVLQGAADSAPPAASTSIEEQLALLRRATQQLEAREGKDLPPAGEKTV